MKLILCFLVIVWGGMAYYEYTWQEQSAAGFQTQISALQEKIDTLEAANQKLTTVKADIARQTADAQRQIDLFKAAAAQPISASPSQWQAVSHGVPLTQTVSLGTLSTIVGKVYRNCRLLKVGVDDITISSDDGITQVPFAYLPPALQKQFGYDPAKAEALKQAEIRYQEQLRQANGPPAGP